jgi:hypothetical protein
VFATLALPRARFAIALPGLFLALALGSGCKASASPEEVAAATLFFPPVYKLVAEPRWSFSDAERLKALQAYTKQGADTLFELIVDADGKVVRTRLLRTPVDEIYHEVLLEHSRRWEFSPDARRSSYRALYYPIEYTLHHDNEWL